MTITPNSSINTSLSDEGLGLPSWLEELLKPGVGQGVFTTLKLSLGERCAQPAARWRCPSSKP